MAGSAAQGSARRRWGAAVILHAGLFAALWWSLTGGAAASWLVGAPFVAAAAAASHRLWPAGTGWWSVAALVRFVGFFLRESARGGLDVARRALAPRMPLDPGTLELTCRLPRGPAEVFLVDVVSLLPGTLSVDLRGRVLTLHVLDRAAPAEADLRALEELVAAIFRVPLAGLAQAA